MRNTNLYETSSWGWSHEIVLKVGKASSGAPTSVELSVTRHMLEGT